MAVDILVAYPEWKQNLLTEIDAQPHAVAKGDAFVSQILQAYYNLSEDDAINATECAGAGDKGIDALYIFPPEEDGIPRALVVQGKYGAAGTGLQLYQEASKFISALENAYQGNTVTDAVDTVANMFKHSGIVNYIIATVEPLNDTQRNDLENIKKLVMANKNFGENLTVEAISLENIYAVLTPEEKTITVDLHCKVVHATDNSFVGVVSLIDMFVMLLNYDKRSGGTIDSIYDHNIRKYIKRSASAVNREIYKTLELNSSLFIAYNNGITITCHKAQQTESGLQLVSPQIVNGCQTTRTLYEFMNKHFAGIDPLHDTGNIMKAYKEAFIAVKVLEVPQDKEGVTYAKNITRFSNKQNVIRGKDFIALEDMYREIKNLLMKRGYFLETQKGEYAALSKAQQMKYPKQTRVIDSFEATLFYAAGILGKPQDAFGSSGDFAPGGKKFESFVNDLTADSLFVPWMIAKHAQTLGYTKEKSIHNPSFGTGHRAQTRHLFLYMFFRIIRKVIADAIAKKKVALVTEQEIHCVLKVILADYGNTSSTQQPQHPFYRLLSFADQAVATFMSLADQLQWYTDRNAFLKGPALMQEDHLIMAIAPVTIHLDTIAKQVQQIVGNTNP